MDVNEFPNLKKKQYVRRRCSIYRSSLFLSLSMSLMRCSHCFTIVSHSNLNNPIGLVVRKRRVQNCSILGLQKQYRHSSDSKLSELKLFSKQNDEQQEILTRNDDANTGADKSKSSFMSFLSNKNGSMISTKDTMAVMKEDNVKKEENIMGDLVKLLKPNDTGATVESKTEDVITDDDNFLGKIIGFAGFGFFIAVAIIFNSLGLSLPETNEILGDVQRFFADPTSALEAVVNSVESMGPMGFFYFGAAYTIAEILAIPAIPLTASAGYLFGVRDGTIVVLFSASIAAAVSFLIGRTFLRDYVEEAIENYPRFKRLDRAIGEEGFKLMLLLRISPIFPFALSNYVYGATRIGFWPFFFGTMIGFSPGTIAYVYTGEIGKSLTMDVGSEPWYVYAAILALFTGFLKVVADVATGMIDKMEDQT